MLYRTLHRAPLQPGCQVTPCPLCMHISCDHSFAQSLAHLCNHSLTRVWTLRVSCCDTPRMHDRFCQCPLTDKHAQNKRRHAHALAIACTSCANAYIHQHTYIHTYMPSYIHAFIHTYPAHHHPRVARVCQWDSTHACMHTCIHACIHTGECTFMRTYTHTQFPSLFHCHEDYLTTKRHSPETALGKGFNSHDSHPDDV